MIWNIATYTEGDSDRGAHEIHVQGKNTANKKNKWRCGICSWKQLLVIDWDRQLSWGVFKMIDSLLLPPANLYGLFLPPIYKLFMKTCNEPHYVQKTPLATTLWFAQSHSPLYLWDWGVGWSAKIPTLMNWVWHLANDPLHMLSCHTYFSHCQIKLI